MKTKGRQDERFRAGQSGDSLPIAFPSSVHDRPRHVQARKLGDDFGPLGKKPGIVQMIVGVANFHGIQSARQLGSGKRADRAPHAGQAI